MKNQTIFILPDGVELRIEGILTLNQGHQIHVDHPDFGEDIRKIAEICHRVKISQGVARQVMEVFLE